jgi:transcriptional regulator with XRE-family HTH domain
MPTCNAETQLRYRLGSQFIPTACDFYLFEGLGKNRQPIGQLVASCYLYVRIGSMLNGVELRKERKRLGLSQAKLADALGVTANTIARWERGEMNIAQPKLVEAALQNLKEIESMSSYDRTMQLAKEGNALALGLLKQCYEWVVKQGHDQDFAARWILGGIPVVNLRTLSARGILEKVGSSRGGHRAYYRMVDPHGVGQALHALRIV